MAVQSLSCILFYKQWLMIIYFIHVCVIIVYVWVDLQRTFPLKQTFYAFKTIQYIYDAPDFVPRNVPRHVAPIGIAFLESHRVYLKLNFIILSLWDTYPWKRHKHANVNNKGLLKVVLLNRKLPKMSQVSYVESAMYPTSFNYFICWNISLDDRSISLIRLYCDDSALVIFWVWIKYIQYYIA